jgi:DNA-binding beta-propeller fold protein YncE
MLAALALPSAALAADPLVSDVVVVNQPERTLQLIEGRTGAVKFTAQMGVNPHEVTVSPDGRYAVSPIYGDAGVGRPGTDGRLIEMVDLETGRVERLDLGQGMRPHDVKFGPDGMLYVTAEILEAVLVIDPRQRKVVGQIPTGRPQSHSLVISPDGRRGFTSNVSTGTVSVLDIPGRRLLGVVQVAGSVQRLSVSPDGRRVYTHDQTAPRLHAIDPETLKVAETYEMPGMTYASAVSPDGKTLLVAGRASAPGAPPREPSLFVLDLKTRAVSEIATPGWPRVIGFEADGKSAWADLFNGHLLRVDMEGRKVARSIKLQPGLDGLALRPAVR